MCFAWISEQTAIISVYSINLSVFTTEAESLDDWLTVHRNITLVDFQLDAQNSNLFTYNTFIKILYMFRVLPCSSSGGLRRNCIYIWSLWYRHSLQSPAESDDTRGCIYIQLRRRPPEDEQGNARNM